MSIQGKVNELHSIQRELKTLRTRGADLRKRSKEIEQEIDDYLVAKDQPGLKYKGMAIIREDKTVRRAKKKIDARNDSIDVLEKYGVHGAEQVLEELLEARRGSPTIRNKLKIKKFKDKN